MGPLTFAPVTPEMAAANYELLRLTLKEPLRRAPVQRSAKPLPIHDTELIAQIAAGDTNAQIAQRCGVHVMAVQQRVTWLRHSTKTRSRAHLVAEATRHGWIRWERTYWAAQPQRWIPGGAR